MSSKLTHVLNVMRSCKSTEQMASTILWASKVLSKQDRWKFVHACQSIVGFDYAVQEAMQIYISKL